MEPDQIEEPTYKAIYKRWIRKKAKVRRLVTSIQQRELNRRVKSQLSHKRKAEWN